MNRTLKSFLLIGILLFINLLSAAFFLLDNSSGTPSALTDYPLDDTWIHLVYARNLAENGGMYYNDGEWEAGTTSPLWVLLIATFWKPFLLLKMEPIFIPKILSILFSFATVILTFLLLRKLTNSNVFSFIGGVLVAVDPQLTFSKVSGMEIHLFISLMLLAIYLFLTQRSSWAGLSLGLALWARPEAYLIMFTFVVAIIINALRNDQSWKERLKEHRYFILNCLLFAVIYSSYFLLVNEKILPNTFYAKSVPLSLSNVHNFVYLLKGFFLEQLPYFFTGIGFLLLLYGVYALFQKKEFTLIPLILLCLTFGITLTTIAWKKAWFFYLSRYFHPLIPLLVVVMIYGIYLFYQALSPRRVLAFSMAALFLASIFIFVPSSFQQQSELYSWNTFNIREMQVHLGEWVNENTKKNATIYVNDAGAIKYFGERYMVDVVGLNNHQWLFTKEVERKADYVIVFPWVLSAIQKKQYSPIYSVKSKNYTICECPQEEMVVYVPK